MNTITQIPEIRAIVRQWKSQGLTIGFVPTMGYLHEGHSSLIEHSVRENDRTIVSIFVNPMQFAPSEDFSTYPRDYENDYQRCNAAGADLIYLPETEDLYPEGFSSYLDMNDHTTELCGKSRPAFFRGVCTVVAKLFNITTPDRAYFGEKDAQQLAVIKHMVRDLNYGLEIVACQTVRESDGLAKSSRNAYLSTQERIAATVLHQSLCTAKEMLDAGEKNAETIVSAVSHVILAEPLAKIDYIQIVDADSVIPLQTVRGTILVAMAVQIGKTRLIDNLRYLVKS